MILGCLQNKVMRRKMDLVSTTNFISHAVVYLTFKNTFKSILTGQDLILSNAVQKLLYHSSTCQLKLTHFLLLTDNAWMFSSSSSSEEEGPDSGGVTLGKWCFTNARKFG